MNKLLIMASLALLCACGKNPDSNECVISMQVIDRNGFTETISNKERLSSFETTDFLSPQSFQKVLRIYKRNANGHSLSKITSYHDNGQLWQYLEAIDGRAHGSYSEWFPSGKLKIQAQVIEGVADIHDLAKSTWVFEGTCKVWEEQGNLVGEFCYEKGFLQGTANYYFPSEKLEKTIPYERGEIHGTMQAFNEEGVLIQEIPYVRNERQGKATTFWDHEQLFSTELYDQGLLIEGSYYDQQGHCIAKVEKGEGKQAQFKEGVLEALFSVEQGRIEGQMQFFNKNGTLHCSYEMREGKKNGEEWEYFNSAPGEVLKPKLYLYWSDDAIQGQVKTWYPSGQMESQREINNNKKQGNAFAWYKNGDLMLMEEYENDLLMKGLYYKKGDKQAVSRIDSGKGTVTLYTSEGVFVKKLHYEKGKPQIQ